ncbi:hypothetical protein A3A01_02335 [Candidatus Nomurabacteria bacterium RIFCSPLOWO2_01_FULL_39_17]|uniref:ATP synthase subunit delta n=1 Tax=Candidatus Nomurabacteria bacterium RIFCSPLOWO2_01_FULL_39_17 TaxID=1801770 RepID=A0A1F6WWN8_9BACT|nr:MAG: hypothetical protein A3A01_02335 [Candidatus Nomurabacteria bacterium RIFCSPLOWO2_01_FULL_39_17]
MANISNIDIARAIYLACKDNIGNKPSFLKDVVKFLARRRFLYRAKDILLNLEKIIHEESGTIVAKVKSARILSEETKREITHSLKKLYSAHKVLYKKSMDENLLGGMRIEVNDEIIDLTVKNKVKKLQEYLTRKV